MKELLRKWLFKEEVERIEWFLERRKNQLERDHQDRANYLEMNGSMYLAKRG